MWWKKKKEDPYNPASWGKERWDTVDAELRRILRRADEPESKQLATRLLEKLDAYPIGDEESIRFAKIFMSHLIKEGKASARGEEAMIKFAIGSTLVCNLM